MDLEVVGRHALLFDDDATAEFVNSPGALVEWNSLSIDRYDVRHLLSAPLPPRPRRRRHSPSANTDDPLEFELDQERYVDLLSSSDSQDLENETEGENAGSYRAVPFLYGNTSEDADQKHADTESEFRPPFSVPEHLLHSLPPTEKVHQIIARTAKFVSKHGGQSEIVLRVKQGDNPTFGFLLPDHDLHPYYRFLVDHQEVLKSDYDGKSVEDENRVESAVDQIGGALSLLGSVYGSIEDEEGTAKNTPEYTRKFSEEVVNGDNIVVSHGSEQTISPPNLAVKDETASKHPVPSLKGKSHVIKRNHSISTFKPGTITGVKKEGDTLGAVSSSMDKLQGSGSLGWSKVEPSILEPTSDLKRVIDKIVEFILRNGKEFEAVLVQQDTKHGRFPFLIPSNQYHPYYLKVLQKAQESRLAGRGLVSEKHDSLGQVADKRVVPKESDAVPLSSDIPYDPDRKEKFRMILGKSKKDVQDQPPKSTLPQVEVSVDAAAAAAILQAATKGIKNPFLSILSKASGKSLSDGPSNEEVNHSSQPQSSNQKRDTDRKCDSTLLSSSNIKMAVAKEADLTEASLTREQKLKADRLKRAKMFAAMIQNKGDRLMNQSLRASSVEPQESVFAELGAQVVNVVEKEREGSAVDMSNKMENSEKKESADSYIDRRPKRKYRFRSRGDEEEDEREGDVEQERNRKLSRKKKRSHCSSHHGRDGHKHRRRHSSSKDKDSRRRHKHDSTSDEDTQDDSGDEYRQQSDSSESGHGQSRHKCKHINSDVEHSRYRHRRDKSSKYKSRHSHNRCKPDISSDDEQRSSRHRQNSNVPSDDEPRQYRHRKKYDSSSDDECHRRSQHHCRHGGSDDDEHRHRKTSNKHRKIAGLEDLEEGEIVTRSDHSKGSEGGEHVSREVSVDLSKSHRDSRGGSHPSETTGVSDDLRAKIRAMLMATL